MRQKILFVGAGKFQASSIKHARNLGYEVFCLDADPEAEGFEFTNNKLIGNIRNYEFIVDAFHQFKCDGILSVATDIPLISVSRACHQIGLPGLSILGAQMSGNKNMQRIAFRGAGLYVPNHFMVDSVSEAEKYFQKHNSPLVVKPIDSSGSRGVSLASNLEDVKGAVELALQNSISGYALLEEFIDGPEIAVDGFMIGNKFYLLSVCDKHRTQPPYLLDEAVLFPAIMDEPLLNQVANVAERALRAASIDNCPFHIEIIKSKMGPMVVEIAARGAGFKVFTEIIPLLTDVDTVDIQIKMALGLNVSINEGYKYLKRGAVINFFSSNGGVFEGVDGIDKARSRVGVKEISIYPSPGDYVERLRCGADRIGHLIAYGDTRADAELSAADAVSDINVLIG